MGEQPRSIERSQETELTRIRMAERDLDIHDGQIDDINAKFSKIMWMLVTVLASMTTSIILFTANLIVR